MRDQDFERIMESWAEHETASAPDLHPTVDLYQMVRARRKRRSVFPAFSPRLTLSTAAASLTLFVVAYILLFQPSMRSGAPSGQRVAFVGQREGFAPGKGVVVRGVTPEKGKGHGSTPFEQLLFHFQKQDARFIEAIDLQAPPKETLTLTSADNYRLFLAPARDGYVTIFQLTSFNTLVKLFPNEAYSAAQNPLQRGQTHYVPAEPNWFYLGQDPGKERLYVVAATGPLPDLEDLYARYSQADGDTDKQEILSSLLEQLEAAPDGWVFVFDHAR